MNLQEPLAYAELILDYWFYNKFVDDHNNHINAKILRRTCESFDE